MGPTVVVVEQLGAETRALRTYVRDVLAKHALRVPTPPPPPSPPPRPHSLADELVDVVGDLVVRQTARGKVASSVVRDGAHDVRADRAEERLHVRVF
jgi:hypothetical protein